MNHAVEIVFYVCGLYLIVGCVWQANVVTPAARKLVKACVWWIMVGATMQLLAGAMHLLTHASMAVSCILSLSLGSFFLFANSRGRNGHHARLSSGG